MRAQVALVTLVALALPAATAGGAPARLPATLNSGPPTPVLGIDDSVMGGQLAWFDPSSLKMLKGRKAPLARHTCSWAFSADRARVALGACNDDELRFVNARAMRVAGDLRLGPFAYDPSGLTWLRPDRLLVLLSGPDDDQVAVVDPALRRVVRRVALPERRYGAPARLADGIVLLQGPSGSFGPARVVVVDAEGELRVATVERITIGSVAENPDSGEPSAIVRGAGFAVDPDGRRAFVVGPDLLTAEVDLDSLHVEYHAPGSSLLSRLLGWLQPAAVAKAVSGPSRTAMWLGNGLVAVAGADYAHTRDAQGHEAVQTTPFGLRIVDTRDWRWRTIDREATWFTAGAGVLVVDHQDEHGVRTAVAYGYDGVERYRVVLAARSWLSLSGGLGYVCEENRLRRVVDGAAGATRTILDSKHERPCAVLLAGSASEW